MSTNPDNKAQLAEMAKAIGAILGVPSVLFTIVNSVFEKPLISLTVALITAVIVSVWVILSRWISVREIITAWLALAVVVLAGFVIWPKTMMVEGFIYDTAHNPIGNEKVRLFDYSGKMYEAKTSAEGYYQFVDVPSGKYRMQVRTSEIEGETKGILVRVVQQNLTVSEITPIAAPTSVAVVTPDTLTATPTPTNTLVPPTSTLTPTPALISATVTAEALNLRAGPGTEYDVIGKLAQGDVTTVIGQNPGGDWLKVKHEGKTGWVAREHVDMPREVAMVPVAEIPPTPTSTPSPEPTAIPTPTQMPLPTTPPPEPPPPQVPLPTTPPPAPAPTHTPTTSPAFTSTPTPMIVRSILVALQTHHDGRYVTAMEGDDKIPESWEVRAHTKNLYNWEKFTLLCLGNGKVALKTYHDRYVTAMEGDDKIPESWEVRAHTRSRLAWEEFILFNADTKEQLSCLEVFELFGQGSVRIALKTCHGRYVTAMEGDDKIPESWEVRAHTNGLSYWEEFTVIPLQ